MECQVVAHLARYVLENHFPSKQAMANALGISYRALLRIFSGNPNENDREQVVYGILCFCLNQDIPLQDAFHDLALR